MAIPLVDLSTKFIIEFGLDEIRKDPDHFIPDIFGDASLPAHSVLYGDRMFRRVKDWLSKTKLPVVLGWDLEPTQVPGITVALGGNAPYKKFVGDRSFDEFQALLPQDRQVLVPAFVPDVQWSDDRSKLYMTPPATLTPEQLAVMVPGVVVRDPSGKEFQLNQDEKGALFIQALGVKLELIDPSSVTIVSPFTDARYKRGSMNMDENVIITVHGSNNSNEGLWLWAMVVYILNRHRATMAGSFGLDLSTPSSTDMVKQEGLEGTNVWRRFVTVGFKANWDWEESRAPDYVAFIGFLRASNPSGSGPSDLSS